MKRKSLLLIFVTLIVLIGATQCSPAASNTTSNSSSSALDGKSLVDTQCTGCHTLDRVQNAHEDANGWKTTVERMVGKGAKLTADEQMAVIEYLAKTYP